MNTSSNLLVLGATGQVGKLVAKNLQSRKANFSVGSRWESKLGELADCGFRGKAGAIPGSIRSAFRNEAGHDSGMKPVTDSDFKSVSLGHLSES